MNNSIWQDVRLSLRIFRKNPAFTVAAIGTLALGIGARHVLGLAVSGEFFPALQLRPAVGRLLSPDDDRPGCPDPGVVLSYSFWQSQFAGRASVIGSKVLILDRPYEVIGVARVWPSGPRVRSPGQTAASLLFGLKPYDPLTLFAAAILLAAVAAIGSYLPARGASRLDPMAALRSE